MLWPAVLFMVAVLVASHRVKGPLWAFAIAWLVCLVPLTTGMIAFDDLSDPGHIFSATLIGYNLPFVVGAALFYAMRRPGSAPAVVRSPAIAARQVAWICWAIGLTGAACVVADFVFYGGGGLSDLQALRDTFVDKQGASLLAQIGSVLTWACLYCYIFVLYYRGHLGRLRAAVLVLPIFGYFLLSLLSAGRQASFQVLIIAVVTTVLTRARRGPVTAATPATRSGLLLGAIAIAMVGYMGFVAVFRNDAAISEDKTEVLATLFNFRLSPAIDAIGDVLGPSVRSVVVEAITYFSSSISIFEHFLTLRLPVNYGATTIPVVLRQFQSITGINPAEVMAARVDALNATGVIGTSWITAIGNYLMDFGFLGTIVILFVSGFYTAFAWDRGVRSNRFEDVVIAVLVMVATIYLPIFPAISDTNLLLLWLFCLGSSFLRGGVPAAIAATPSAAA